MFYIKIHEECLTNFDQFADICIKDNNVIGHTPEDKLYLIKKCNNRVEARAYLFKIMDILDARRL